MEAPTNNRDVWTRWIAWTTAAEVGGFTVPGVVGVATSSRAGTAQWPDLREVLPRSASRVLTTALARLAGPGGGHGAALLRLPTRDHEVAQVR